MKRRNQTPERAEACERIQRVLAVYPGLSLSEVAVDVLADLLHVAGGKLDVGHLASIAAAHYNAETKQ